MTEPLDLFSTTDDPPRVDVVQPLSPEQRDEIRVLFAQLGITSAQEQFALVEVLIGLRLQSVAGLDSKNAAALIPRLRKRVDSRSKSSSGSAWDTREEDTWIDNL